MSTEPVRVRRPLGDRACDAFLYYGQSCLETLTMLSEGSVQCVVSSPPYFQLRDYEVRTDCWPRISFTPMSGMAVVDVPEQQVALGLEEDVTAYVAHLVHVFRLVRRVMREDATAWLVLGDSYAKGRTNRDDGRRMPQDPTHWKRSPTGGPSRDRGVAPGLKEKDLVGIPWRVAFALQADGWYLRSDVIWAKSISGESRVGTCMPESVTDRPTQSKEYVFLLSRSPSYFFDMDAVREPHTMRPQARPSGHKRRRPGMLLPEHTWRGTARDEADVDGNVSGRNLRSVWHLNPQPYKGAHFAVFPPALPRLCILAGTSERGCCPMCGTPWTRVADRETYREKSSTRSMNKTPLNVVRAGSRTTGWAPACGCPGHEPVPCTVLDPFSGSGTAGFVALNHGRDFVGLDVNAEYLELAKAKILGEPPPVSEDDGGPDILKLMGVEDS